MQTYTEYLATMKSYNFCSMDEELWQSWQIYYHDRYKGNVMKPITCFEELDIDPKYKDQREDYQNIDLAVELGWTVDASMNIQKGLTFVKGTKHVWKTKYYWQVADLIDNRYQNHKPANTLKEALERD